MRARVGAKPVAQWDRWFLFRGPVGGARLDRDLSATFELAALGSAVAGSGLAGPKASGEAGRPGSPGAPL